MRAALGLSRTANLSVLITRYGFERGRDTHVCACQLAGSTYVLLLHKSQAHSAFDSLRGVLNSISKLCTTNMYLYCRRDMRNSAILEVVSSRQRCQIIIECCLIRQSSPVASKSPSFAQLGSPRPAAIQSLPRKLYQLGRTVMGAGSDGFVVPAEERWWDDGALAIVTGGEHRGWTCFYCAVLLGRAVPPCNIAEP